MILVAVEELEQRCGLIGWAPQLRELVLRHEVEAADVAIDLLGVGGDVSDVDGLV
jgi:hypothetical protein